MNLSNTRTAWYRGIKLNFEIKNKARCATRFLSLIRVGLVMLITSLMTVVARAEMRLNLQDPVTDVAREIYGLHMLIFWICVGIFVAVFSVMFYSIFKHRKSKGHEPAQFSHSTKVEVVWTVIPFLILVVMAIPATQVLIKMEDTTKSDLTIKITGYQWKWGYEYLDSGIDFYSTLSTPRSQIDQFDADSAQPLGENYLLEVDNHLVVPSGRKVRALITANDVIHAWWIPAFGTKKDAIPGYINELWFNVDEGKEGIYRGQCAELCGKDHAYMPIVVEVVSGDEFDAWVAAGGTFDGAENLADDEADSIDDSSDTSAVNTLQPVTETVEADAPADQTAEPAPAPVSTSTVTFTKDELMAKGKQVAVMCEACHGSNGEGVAGINPAISGSPIANGPVDAHIDIVMFGQAGTAMMAFANQLSDEDIAAVVTYQRNAYGNSTGDVVLPSDVQAKRN